MAYINQYVATDPEFAEQTFGKMFKDWGAVVEASKKFNKDMGATSSEAASFIRRTPKLRLDANGRVTTESVIDNEENADLQSTSNEVLQTGENDDIIEIRGDSDEFDNRGRALESVEEIRRRFFTQSGHEEDKRSIRESYEAFAERTSNTDERSGEKTKRIVRIGKTALAFTPSEADTPLRRFVEELNKIGIEAYCCEGDIESNLNLTAK